MKFITRLLTMCFTSRNINHISNDFLKESEFLKDKTFDNTPYFDFEGMTMIAKPCQIYDGDTFTAIFRYEGIVMKYRCRMYGYDSPEMKPSLKIDKEIREEEIRKAKLAKNKLEELLFKNNTKCVELECKNFDKYGRILVNVNNLVDENSINSIMIKEGFGYPYLGGKKNVEVENIYEVSVVEKLKKVDKPKKKKSK